MEFTTQLLYAHDQALLAIMIFVIMLGMGASLTVDDFRAVARKPKGVFIGFISQFGLMPFIAFGLATILNFPPAFAIALILIGCLPGGTTSNMFTYFARGSVALSISMTTASTILALFMMPILLKLYTSWFYGTNYIIHAGHRNPGRICDSHHEHYQLSDPGAGAGSNWDVYQKKMARLGKNSRGHGRIRWDHCYPVSSIDSFLPSWRTVSENSHRGLYRRCRSGTCRLLFWVLVFKAFGCVSIISKGNFP
jgi:hypothetical protein